MSTSMMRLSAADPGSSEGSFYMLVCMFLVGCAVLALVIRWYGQWRSPIEQRKLDREEAKEYFGQIMSERIGLAMQAAELDAVIVEKWNEWPVEYQPALQQVLRYTQVLEETMYNEAVARGIYPRRIVTNGPMIPPPPAETPLADAYRNDDEAPTVSQVVPLRGRRWINGQLLRTG